SVLQYRFEIVQQPGCVRAVSLRELTGAITLDRPTTDSAEYPFGDVAGEMHEQITDAVGRLIRPRPHDLTWQRVDAAPDLDRILLGQPVPRSSYKIVGEGHQAVFATAAARVSLKTSSANSTLPNGADTCTPCT